MIVTEAIQRFLTFYTHKDLASLYNPGMEVQVMVKPDGGQPTENGRSYSNGIYTWYNFRIPKNARTTPVYTPWNLQFPLAQHALAVGMTGWDFIERKSMHLGYDFDKICETSHQGTGVSAEEIDRVREAACAIPWVEVRKSTGGGGLHLRVHLGKGVPTENHTEHAALGRAILGMMSAAAGFNFAEQVDICGGNMWVWHQKMTPENEGLLLIKQRQHDLTDISADWRNHIEVVSNKRRKVRVAGIPESEQESFTERAEGTSTVTLDDGHRKLMDWLVEGGFTCVWEPDHQMLRTHTAALREAHAELGMKGFFKTLATGSEGKADHNCFCFPRPDGSWRVVRYGGNGVLEANTWIQDGDWTFCYLNQQPTLKEAAAIKGGIEDEKGGYVFPTLILAAEVAKVLGGKLDVEADFQDRKTKLKMHKDGKRLVVEVDRDKDDGTYEEQGYLSKKSGHSKIINASLATVSESSIENYDSKVRCVRTPAGKVAGWVIAVEGGGWCEHPKDNVISVLMDDGMSGSDAKAATGAIIKKSWLLSNLPFQPEYPGGRRWNKDAAQFRYKPADEEGEHPHFDKILTHCGKGLDGSVLANPWCQQHGLYTGGDYLKHWLAAMIQHPFARLPYLFLFSEPYQNCGKSSFHQAASLLFTKGVMRADQALQSTGNFNGELNGAILCVVEETDLSKQGGRIYDKIKDLVTSQEINIHIKNLTPYMQANTTHFIQCSNTQRACPVFDGDTRVTMIQVPSLPKPESDAPNKEIPWPLLEEKLKEEAPAFLRTLLNTSIPPSNSRLRIPVIESEDKTRAIEMTRNELQSFIADNCHYAPGERMLFSDFYEKFHESLDMAEKMKWPKSKVTSEMPPKFPRGFGAKNATYIGNISFEPPVTEGVAPLIRDGRNLVIDPNHA